MKKLFYFSKSSLKYVEIKNFNLKLFALLIVISFLFTSVFLVLNYFLGIDKNPHQKISSLKSENRQLKEEIKKMAEKYQNMVSEVNDISEMNSELRIAANLEAISDEEKMIGIGGSENSFSSGISIKDIEIKNLLNSVDELIGLVNFEKEQTVQIAQKLNRNEELYACLPALKPTVGDYSIDGFGMRRHPILGVRKFHHGIDINCDYGTEVHSPGNGTVMAVERRAGFGLIVELDHGFGYRTIYAHLSKAMVKRGELIKRGQVIAKSGNSGLSSGPHLHYEVHHNGISVDPTDFFFDDLTFFDLKSQNISRTEK